MTSNDEAAERSQFLLDEDGFSDSETESQADFTPPPPVQSSSARAKLKSLLFGGVAATAPTTESSSTTEYKLYPWRWFMLASLFLLNISNGTMWLTFAPIPQYTALFYDISLSQVDWFSISYFVVSLLTGFVAIVILDVFGLKVSLYLGAIFNLIGSALRWLSIAGFIICSSSTAAFAVAMCGQILTACAQPFLLYAPTKLANSWFGPKERAFCTMLASLGNPLGLAAAQLTSPNIVTGLNKFLILHVVYTSVAAVGGVITLISFWWSEPVLAPAPSAVKSKVPFLKGLKDTLANPTFLWLMVVWGCGSGLVNALLTLLAQILCPYGYSDRASGLWGALMVFVGLLGATVGGVVIDITKLYKEVAVIAFSVAILFYLAFMMLFDLVGQKIAIAFSISLFGFFGLPLIPACMEMGVEVTYPVSEATSSGLLWSTTQVVGIIMVLLGQWQQQELSGSHAQHSQCDLQEIDRSDHVCSSNSSLVLETIAPQDFTRPLLIYAGIAVAGYLVLILLFRPSYKRLAVERRAKGILDHLKKPGSYSTHDHSPSHSSSPQHPPTRISKSASPPHAAPMSRLKPNYHASTEF